MRAFFIVLLSVGFTAISSCKKAKNSNKSVNATIVRDCTGTYLRMDNKDYQVCNVQFLSSLPDGSAVQATYNELAECNFEGAVCYMYHENEGWIEVTEVN